MIIHELVTSYSRGPNKYSLQVYNITPRQWFYEKLFHKVMCRGIERLIPKKILNIYVPDKWVGLGGFKDKDDVEMDITAPIYVWFDMHCPLNTGKYRHGHHVGQIELSEEEYMSLSKKR